MRIAVWYNLPSGGAKRALWHHVKGLVEKGHYVEAWCPERDDVDYLPLTDFCTEHVLPMTTQGEEIESRSPTLRAIREYQKASRAAVAFAEHCRCCAYEIMQGGFDVLFANNSVIFKTSPIGRFVNIPSVLYLQEPRRELYEAFPRSPWAAPAMYSNRFLPGNLIRIAQEHILLESKRESVRDERANAAGYRTLLVNSRYSRESILRAYGLESRVCYLGIDTDMFCPTGETRSPFVIGLGELGHHKGIDRALRAVAAIPLAQRPEFVWVGNRAQPRRQKRFQALAKMLNVNFSIKVAISDPELVRLLSSATAMLYTSRLEPFGFAPLEAGACETPVVGIAEGGIRETIVEGVTGCLVPDDNPEEIAQAILRLFNNPDTARIMGQAARKHVLENWSWRSAIDTLEQHLVDTMAQHMRDGKRGSPNDGLAAKECAT